MADRPAAAPGARAARSRAKAGAPGRHPAPGPRPAPDPHPAPGPRPAAPAPRWAGALAALACGVVAATAHPPFGLLLTGLPALAAGLWLVARARTARSAFARGWLLGAGYFAATLAWIVEPFLVDAPTHGWMAPFALIGMAGGLALFWAAAGALARLARPGHRIWLLALVLTLAELARGTVLTGFPWALPAYAWIGRGWDQALAWVGPYGLTAMTLLACAALAAGAERLWQGRPAGALLAAALIPAIAGSLLLHPGPAPAPDGLDTPDGPAGPLIRLVQSGAPQAEKWATQTRDLYIARLIEGAAARPPAALTVWPETAVPFALRDAQPVLDAGARAAGGPLATGLLRQAPDGWRNALVVTDAGGAVAAAYDKRHLVPFGEYIPFEALIGRLGLSGLADGVGGITPGAARASIAVPGLGLVWPLICYEGIFPRLAAPTGPRPRALLLITNDAWFGAGQGPLQHLAQGRARAIEQGLPMIRAAQTGVSAMIDARGRVTAAIPLGAHGEVAAPLPPVRPPTPYARTGDGPAALLTALAALALVAAARIDRGRAAP
ncbi:MAG: apolipoprotein N-acyltransferase [Paracoccaceae bacterium]